MLTCLKYHVIDFENEINTIFFLEAKRRALDDSGTTGDRIRHFGCRAKGLSHTGSIFE